MLLTLDKTSNTTLPLEGAGRTKRFEMEVWSMNKLSEGMPAIVPGAGFRPSTFLKITAQHRYGDGLLFSPLKTCK